MTWSVLCYSLPSTHQLSFSLPPRPKASLPGPLGLDQTQAVLIDGELTFHLNELLPPVRLSVPDRSTQKSFQSSLVHRHSALTDHDRVGMCRFFTGRSLYIQSKNTTHDNCTQTSLVMLMLIHVTCVIHCDSQQTTVLTYANPRDMCHTMWQCQRTVVLTVLTAPGPGVGRSRGQSSSPSRCRSATASSVRAYKVLCHITCHTQGDDHTPTSHSQWRQLFVSCDTVFYIWIIHCENSVTSLE